MARQADAAAVILTAGTLLVQGAFASDRVPGDVCSGRIPLKSGGAVYITTEETAFARITEFNNGQGKNFAIAMNDITKRMAITRNNNSAAISYEIDLDAYIKSEFGAFKYDRLRPEDFKCQSTFFRKEHFDIAEGLPREEIVLPAPEPVVPLPLEVKKRAAPPERQLAEFPPFVALAPAGFTCATLVTVTVRALDEADFTNKRVELQKLVGGLRAILGFECPKTAITDLVIVGEAGGKQIYHGATSESGNWLLKDGRPVTVSEQPTQPSLPPVAGKMTSQESFDRFLQGIEVPIAFDVDAFDLMPNPFRHEGKNIAVRAYYLNMIDRNHASFETFTGDIDKGTFNHADFVVAGIDAGHSLKMNDWVVIVATVAGSFTKTSGTAVPLVESIGVFECAAEKCADIVIHEGGGQAEVAAAAPGIEENALADPDVASALIQASAEGDLEKVRDLLAKGTDINAKRADGETALLVATRRGNASVVQELIAKGADVNVRDRLGDTALNIASDKRYQSIVDLLKSGPLVGGMTTEEVLTAWGNPIRKEIIPPDMELWHYPTSDVAFQNGKVSYVEVK